MCNWGTTGDVLTYETVQNEPANWGRKDNIWNFLPS